MAYYSVIQRVPCPGDVLIHGFNMSCVFLVSGSEMCPFLLPRNWCISFSLLHLRSVCRLCPYSVGEVGVAI